MFTHIIVIGNQFALTTPSDTFLIIVKGKNTGINAPCVSFIDLAKETVKTIKTSKNNMIQFKKCKFEREEKERKRERYWCVGRGGVGLSKGIQQFTVKRH